MTAQFHHLNTATLRFITFCAVPGVAVPSLSFAQTVSPSGTAKAAAKAAPSRVNVQAELDALIKAAKAEGELTLYSVAPESGAKRTADAFAAKYGIKAQFTRISSTDDTSRFPKEQQPTKSVNAARRQEFMKLLGF